MDECIYELQNYEIENKINIIVGQEKIREQLKDILSLVFANANDKEKNIFLDIKGNVLLYGKPGVGKTSISYELANYAKKEYRASFYLVNLSTMISEKLGQTAKKLDVFFKNIIEKTKKYKVVLLIEEIEVFLPDRNSTKELEDMKRALTVFMHYLDKQIDNLLIITTTNHVNTLDKAIARRFSFVYNIECKEKRDFVKFLTHVKNPFRDGFFDKHLNEEITSRLVEKNYSISDLKHLMRKMYISTSNVNALELLSILKEE